MPDPADSVPAAAPVSHLSWREKIGYGVGGSTMFFGTNTVKTLAIPFFQMTLNVNPALLGLAMAVPRLWDAFTDPVMGYLSDTTRSRWGRRRPYIFIGALLSCLSYIAIWFVPLGWTPNAQVGWYLVTSLVFFTALTMWLVPYTSLGYEMTPDYDERTSVMGISSIATQISQFAGPWIFPLAQLAIFTSVVQGLRVITVVIGFVFIAGVGILPALLAKERYASLEQQQASSGPKPNIWKTFRQAFRNRNMALLMGLQLAGAISSIFASGLDFYVIVYYMFDGDLTTGATWKAILSTGFAVCGFISVPLLIKASRRFDKCATLQGVYVLNMIGAVATWFVFNPSHPWLILLNPMLCTHVYTAGLLKQSMVADICDEDELATGHRHEGSYGALFAWVHKTAMSLSFLAAGVVLNMVGFDSTLGGNQAAGVTTNIRLVLVAVPFLSSAVSLLLLSRYNLNRQRATEIRAALEARRGQL